MTTTHAGDLLFMAQVFPPHHTTKRGDKVWLFNDWTVTQDWLRDTFTVQHTPVTYSATPPLNHDWTHELTTGEFYTFRVYPLSTGGEWRVPINDAAIEAYEAGKDDDGLYAWEWMAQWLAGQDASLQTEGESEEAQRLQ